MGNNEKRIGDIYTEAGNADEANKAYETAREWYGKALEANKSGAETEAFIKAQIQSLPGAKAEAETPAAEAPVVEVETPAAEVLAVEAETPAAEVPAVEAETPAATPDVVDVPAS